MGIGDEVRLEGDWRRYYIVDKYGDSFAINTFPQISGSVFYNSDRLIKLSHRLIHPDCIISKGY